MVDITKIVEKGMKDENNQSSNSKKAKPKAKVVPEEKTALDNLFGEKNQDNEDSSKDVGFSKKLGDLFGVDEENDG